MLYLDESFIHHHFIEALAKGNSLIVLGNGSFHKGLPSDMPKGNWSKAALQEACNRFGIVMNSGNYKREILVTLIADVTTHVAPVIVSMAAACSHQILFTPPYHASLQPIELLSAYLKGKGSRQYTVDTSFAVVRARLDAAFDEILSEGSYKSPQ
ncbi:hypothetical protein ACHHYP_20807 [Achlya hypogyna]|uniref:Tc1-like transposase DDE domain-containing protein n=1 Tax=Achlya hypogyna TaxID=1202772 RepID=A0A1V9Y984_ACHHY|nr:hypothetical protein ACHHYP_20807 [Achlya hypogyna]